MPRLPHRPALVRTSAGLSAQSAVRSSPTLSALSSPRRCGRGIGEKRLQAQALAYVTAIFERVAGARQVLAREGHGLIVASQTLQMAAAHQALDRLLELLEDFLWVVNGCIAREGGTPRLI